MAFDKTGARDSEPALTGPSALHQLPAGRKCDAPGSHLSTGALVFTAALAFLGVGLFFVILGLAATAIVEGRVSLFSRSRRMRRRLDELRGHFIVCAYGRVGRSIAGELEAAGVPFVVVDSKAGLEPDLERAGQCYLIAMRRTRRCCARQGSNEPRG